MKKILISALAAMALISLATIQGCKKDDTTAPEITLSGSNPMTIVLNASNPGDPSATANDNEDGAVSVTSDWSSTNPNVNLAGTYTISYTASDKAGNAANASRTVYVKNSADNLAGSYLVTDTCGVLVFNYAQTITASNTVNNRIHFNKFADYSSNSGIYADITGTSITLPSQTANNIGSLMENHQFSGTGAFVTSPNVILHLNYTDTNNSTFPPSTASCTAWFVKQ